MRVSSQAQQQQRTLSPPLGTVQAHQTRSMTVSWAHFQGVHITEIMKAACWKNPSTFTSCYLRDVLQTEGSVGRQVLQWAARPSSRKVHRPSL